MAGYIEVAKSDNAIYVRVVGLGNFNNAGPLREYAESAFEAGTRSAVIDLARCTGLDSTFMGTLVLMKDFPVEETNNKTSISVTIVNATATTLRAMTSLGLPKLLHVKDEHVDFPAVKLERLREGWHDQRRRTRLIHDAHLQLVRADKENEARFGPFLAALVKEARLHSEGDSKRS